MNDDQERLEGIVAWYAAALGLADWRIEVRAGENVGHENDAAGDVWISDWYDNAIVGVKKVGETWTHDDDEQAAAHELVHILLEPMARMYRDALGGMDVPSRAYDALDRQFDRLYEHAVDRLALGLVACARAERAGPPPMVGALLRKTGRP